MHRKLDTTRARSRSTTALAAAALIACTTLVAGCSDDAPTPKDQRDQMLSTTQTVVEGLVDQLELADPAVVDDGSETVSCPDGGTQFRYIVYGLTDVDSTYADDIDGALDVLNDTVYGVVAALPDGATYSGGDDVEIEPDGVGPRQLVFFVEHGAEVGMSLTFDMVPGHDGSMMIRVAGATTCG